jgi:hypothetical protein
MRFILPRLRLLPDNPNIAQKSQVRFPLLDSFGFKHGIYIATKDE